jgi:hypothetical protein
MATAEGLPKLSRRAFLIEVAVAGAVALLAACGENSVPAEAPIAATAVSTEPPQAPPTVDPATVAPPVVAVTEAPAATAVPPTVIAAPTVGPTPEVESLFVVNPELVVGPINRRVIATNLVKEIRWIGNDRVVEQMRLASLGLVRVGVVQNAMVAHGIHTVEGISDHALQLGKTIGDAGAEPLALIVGYPSGTKKGDWGAYAETFIAPFVRRTRGVLRRIQFWNEREHEPDGQLTLQEYLQLLEAAVPVVRRENPDAVIYGIAAPHSDHPDIDAAARSGLVDVTAYNNYSAPEVDVVRVLDQVDPRYREDLGDKVRRYRDMNVGVGISEFNATPTYDFGPFELIGDRVVEQVIGVHNTIAMMNAQGVGADSLVQFAHSERGRGVHGLYSESGEARKRVEAWHVYGSSLGAEVIEVDASQAPVATNGGLRVIASVDHGGQNAYVVFANPDSTASRQIGVDVGGRQFSTVGLREFTPDTSPAQTELSVQGNRVVYTVRPLSVVGIQIPLS